MKSRMLGVPSYWKGVELLGAMSGKRVLLEGFSEWPDEHTETNWAGMAYGAEDKHAIRELFERLCLALGVVWHYDPERDVIHLDPKWRSADPRAGKELIRVLLEVKPVPWTELPRGARNGVGGTDLALDDWRLSFDALLSRPDNLASAGTLRLYHDTHGHLDIGPHPVRNLYAGKILDGDGQQRIIVLNGQESMSTKDSAGDVAWYLFDEDGKFIRGGVFSVGEKQQGYIGKVVAYNDRDLTVVFGLGRLASELIYIHFTLEADDLTLQSSTDFKGRLRNADKTQTTFPEFPEGLIRQKFSASTKPAAAR